MSFTQPICDSCWPPFSAGMSGVIKEPVRLKVREEERCCFCNWWTESGIYVRVDPQSVPHPTPDDAHA